jgi:hypothetical protein
MLSNLLFCDDLVSIYRISIPEKQMGTPNLCLRLATGTNLKFHLKATLTKSLRYKIEI